MSLWGLWTERVETKDFGIDLHRNTLITYRLRKLGDLIKTVLRTKYCT